MIVGDGVPEVVGVGGRGGWSGWVVGVGNVDRMVVMAGSAVDAGRCRW